MNITLTDGLPFISATVSFREQEITLDNVLLDTGSAGSIFKAELLRSIGIYPEANDYTCAIRGIGGSEVVFFKTINSVKIEDVRLDQFEIEVGEMNYGFPIDGILGFDFMQLAGIVIDTRKMEIHQGCVGFLCRFVLEARGYLTSLIELANVAYSMRTILAVESDCVL